MSTASLPPQVTSKPAAAAAANPFSTDPKYRKLLDKFVSRLPERVSKMTDLLRQQDLAELQRAVHQLKGAGHGYGFASITELAGRAEDSIKAEGGLDAVRQEVEALIELIRNVEGYDRSREAAAGAAAPGAPPAHA
jgi:HPt (histidine-containing phosphotransfer) domain-containing protein